MANDEKKVTVSLPVELYRLAKAKAILNSTSLDTWIVNLIQSAVENGSPDDLPALDWGRIDSRIDHRVAILEQQLDRFSAALEQIKRDRQPPTAGLHLVESTMNSIMG